MRTKPLGGTGEQVAEIGLGTWKYGGDPAVVHRALEVGANLIDTAEMYDTERQVGAAIAGNRSAYFVGHEGISRPPARGRRWSMPPTAAFGALA